MSDTSDAPDDTHRILNQADALMNRHRSHRVFLARNTAEATPGDWSADTAALIEEDFPVLTEIVSVPDGGSGQEVPSTSLETGRERIAAVQRQQIEDCFARWLDNRLPDEVLRVMDGVSDQLIGSLVARMREELLPELLAAAGNDSGGAEDNPQQMNKNP